MSENQIVSDEPTNTPVENRQESNSDTVKYDTYRKVLSEKKRAAEELNKLREEMEQIRSAEKQAEEQQLAEQQRFKEIADIRAKEAEELRSELGVMRKAQNDMRKMDALLKHVPIKRKFWDHVNLDSIVLDPNSGDVEPSTVTQLAEVIRTEYVEYLDQPSNAPKLDATAPIPNNTGSLKIDDFMKLNPQERDASKLDGAPDWMTQGVRQFSRQK